MIKGNIEFVGESNVSGWIYAQDQEMRGKTVLAFLDGECIGATTVSTFRQDLADAGLGDGFLGFEVPVRQLNVADRLRIIVRLDGSDAVLLQQGVTVGGNPRPNARLAIKYTGRLLPPASLQWMLARGWLTQADHDFLKFFGRMGVYDRTLRLPRGAGDAADPGRQDPALLARDLLGLWSMRDVEVTKRQVRPQDDLSTAVRKQLQEAESLPIYALWGADRGKIAVVEGSHANEDDDAASVTLPFIEYPFGPDRLLLLDGNASIRKPENLPQVGVVVFTAKVIS